MWLKRPCFGHETLIFFYFYNVFQLPNRETNFFFKSVLNFKNRPLNVLFENWYIIILFFSSLPLPKPPLPIRICSHYLHSRSFFPIGWTCCSFRFPTVAGEALGWHPVSHLPKYNCILEICHCLHTQQSALSTLLLHQELLPLLLSPVKWKLQTG